MHVRRFEISVLQGTGFGVKKNCSEDLLTYMPPLRSAVEISKERWRQTVLYIHPEN